MWKGGIVGIRFMIESPLLYRVIMLPWKPGRDVFPVNDQGCYTDDVEYFAGQFVLEANQAVNAQLKAVGALVKEERFVHSYPHCWRCKEPVIFRATPQWFISMDKKGLRQNSLQEIEKVQWIPHWGKDRIYGMIENRPDWCVSRQRAWGVPITVFYCENCSAPHMTEALMQKIRANPFKTCLTITRPVASAVMVHLSRRPIF